MDDPEGGEVRERGEAGQEESERKESERRHTRMRAREWAWIRRDDGAKSRGRVSDGQDRTGTNT